MAYLRNRFEYEGRLTADINLQTASNGSVFCYFTLATNYKDQNDNIHSEFIDFVAWNNAAKFLANYCKKGELIGVDGRIKNRTAEDDTGKKVHYTELVVNKPYKYHWDSQEESELATLHIDEKNDIFDDTYTPILE